MLTRNELIDLLKKNIKPNAELDFLLIDKLDDGKNIVAFLNIDDICMNADVDDPDNKERGGIVFRISNQLI